MLHTGILFLLGVIIFWALLLPALLQFEDAARAFSQTSTVSVTATLDQTQPTYVVRNPDVLVTSGNGTGWIVITPQKLSIRKYLFFGTSDFAWAPLKNSQTWQNIEFVQPLVIILLPSAVFWTLLLAMLSALAAVAVWSCIAYAVARARKYALQYSTMWKIGVASTIPSLTIFALSPVLRVGLPVGVLACGIFLLWLALASLGSFMVAERETPKAGHKTRTSE